MISGAPATFFSYCRSDSDFALKLAGDLKAAGTKVWVDQLDILPGQRWDRAIEDALTNCQQMVVILSPESVRSQNVMDEVSFAIDEGKTIIPVIYRECSVPLRLRRVQHIDFIKDYGPGLKELHVALDIAHHAQGQAEQPSRRAEVVVPQAAQSLPASTEDPESSKRNHYATASVLSGSLAGRVIPAQAFCALSDTNGLTDRRMEAFQVPGFVSCKSGHTQATGNVDPATGSRTTVVTATVEGLNVMDVLTVERVVARVSVEQVEGSSEPRVSFLGSRLENLRIAGEPIHVALSRDPLSAQARKRYENQREFEEPGSPGPKVGPGHFVSSLIEQTDGTRFPREANKIYIPDLGKLSLGEIKVDPDALELTMIHLQVSSGLRGFIKAAVVTWNSKL